MPCNFVPLPGGGYAIACTRGRAQKRCKYCGAPADRLCDFALTGEKAGQTCDVPMCSKCSHRPAGTEQDYCRAHAALVTEGVRG